MSPEVERRRRLVTRTLPLALIAVVAFVFGAAAGAPGSPGRTPPTASPRPGRGDDFAAMYRELNPASQAAIELNDFAIAYREAEQMATLTLARTRLRPRPLPARRRDRRPGADRRRHGRLRPLRRRGRPALLRRRHRLGPEPRLPGPARGEHLESQIELAPRAAILAADGTPLAEGPADGTRTPAGQRRDRRHRRSRQASEEDQSRSWPARASPPTRRSASAASSGPSTPASPASRAARCWPSTNRRLGPHHRPGRTASRGRR